MLTDAQIREAIEAGELTLDPFDDASLQPASYDLRVGKAAFASSSKERVDIANRGVVIIEPGEFAVVETRERVDAGPRLAIQLGLRSEFARKGLLLLSGPQVDPGFHGVLVVRVVNLAPQAIALAYESPFLTAQFFLLSHPVAEPYSGARQGQTGITPTDVQELSQTEGQTLGEMLKTLTSLARDVAELRGSVGRLPTIIGWGIGVISAILLVGITVMAILATRV